MVKLFGWEKMMSEKLQQTREEELHWLFKEKVRGFLYFTSPLKYAPRFFTCLPALSGERLSLLHRL